MKTCLNCQKEFGYKREAAKFCSDKCRVTYNRANPKERVTKTQMQALYNLMMDKLGQIEFAPSQAVYDAPKLPANFKADEPLSFDRLKQEQVGKGQLPTFQQIMNKIPDLLFADERDEMIHKVRTYTHLTDKQQELLILNLQAQR